MIPALTGAAFGLLAFCIALEIGTQLCFKAGSDRMTASGQVFPRSLLTQRLLWFGVGLWAVEVVAWVMVLQRAPLAVAYPVMTLTYATIPLASLAFLGERMSRRQLAGAALIAAGVACVALAGV